MDMEVRHISILVARDFSGWPPADCVLHAFTATHCHGLFQGHTPFCSRQGLLEGEQLNPRRRPASGIPLAPT